MRFRFGRYELDEEAGELRCDGESIAIQPKPLALLAHLIRERERVVPFEELYELLWAGVAVTPSSLTRAVSVARSAIGDTGRGDVIKSIARRGYRFHADVLAIDTASPAAPARADAARDPFVGRDDALARLRAAWSEALGGAARIALVTGPPGIGKTRLGEELVRELGAAGARVFTARARDGEGVPALWLWAQVLRQLAALPPGAHGGPLATAAGALAELAPELATGVPAAERGAAARSPDQNRFLLFEAITGALVAVARERPVLLFLEDLQWAGSSSLRLLEHLAFEAAGVPLLVVATVRNEPRAREHAVERLLGILRAQRNVLEVGLRGFSRREVAQLIERTLGRPAPPDLSSELVARTEGVPLLLREALRLLADRGDLRRAEHVRRWAVSLPSQALDFVQRPVERLSPACQGLLAAGAVLGREWTLPLAAAVADLARDAALDLADEAAAAGVVEPAPESPATWRFSHALFQEGIYGRIPAGARARLHARAAQEIERRHGAHADPVIAELAHHHHESLAVGDPERAYAAAVRAAARAERVFAFEQVATHWDQALAALAHAQPLDPERRLATLLALGEALRLSGDRSRRRSVFGEAIEAARALGRPRDFARAAIGFCDITEWAPRDPEARRLLTEALALLGDEPSAERCRVLTRLGYLGARFSDADYEAIARRAVEDARAVVDPDALQEALYTLHFLIGSPDRLEERAELGADIVGASLRSTARDSALIALIDAASDRLALGDAAGARRARREAEALVAPNPHHGLVWHLRCYDAGLAHLEGRFDEAERLASEAFAIGTRIEHPFAAGVHLVHRTELWRELDAWDALVAGVDVGNTTPWLRALAGRALVALGRTEEARALLDALAARGFDDVRRNVRWLKTLIEIAGLACDLADARHAEALIERLAPLAHQHAVLPVPIGYGGPASWALARLHALAGRSDAGELFDEAYEAAIALGARPTAARVLVDHAAWLARRGDRRGAREHGERGAALATSLGMPAVAERGRTIASR